jgi:hypothetical protein
MIELLHQVISVLCAYYHIVTAGKQVSGCGNKVLRVPESLGKEFFFLMIVRRFLTIEQQSLLGT